MSYPDLPDPYDPKPDEWLAALRPELEAMEGERVVLCHSLACLLWLLNARAGATDVADRVLLVAPPCTGDVEAVVRFRADGVMLADVERAAGETLMFCGSPDPYSRATSSRHRSSAATRPTMSMSSDSSTASSTARQKSHTAVMAFRLSGGSASNE